MKPFIAGLVAVLALALCAFAPVRLEDEERLASQLLKYPPRCVVCTVVHEAETSKMVPVEVQQPKRAVPTQKWADASGPQVVQVAGKPKAKRKGARPPEVTYARIQQHVSVLRCVVLDPRCK